MHIYANADTGDDSYSGYAPDFAKKTLVEAFKLIPRQLNHFCCVHLSGTFVLTDYTDVTVPAIASTEKYAALLITGDEDAVTVVDDNGGLNFTATGGSATTVDVAGAGWNDEQHAGYLVEFLTGDATGYKAACFGGTDRQLFLGKLPVAPGAGDTFRLVKPATRITSTVAYKGLRFWGPLGGGSQGANVSLANVEIDGQAYLGVYESVSAVAMRNVFINTTGSISFSLITQNARINPGCTKMDPTTGQLSYSEYYHFGVSIHTSKVMDLREANGYNLISASWVKPSLYISGGMPMLGYNTVVSGTVNLKGVQSSGHSFAAGQALLESSSFYGYTPRFLGGVVLRDVGEDASIENVHISNPSGPALTVLGSNPTLGAVTGSGSTFGAKVSRGSFVSLSAAPTLTGPSGYLTFDGSTVTSGTWASIKAGGAVSNTTEMSTVKSA